MSFYEKLLESTGTWDAFKADWKSQCEKYDEDFEDYASNTFDTISEIITTDEKKSGIFAFKEDGKFISMCQLNVAGLPKYDSPVMRIRFLTLCPDIDFGETTIDEYGNILTTTLASILAISSHVDDLKVNHIKMHLRSPADRQFFAMLGKGLNETDVFASVQTVGAWLYITKE